MIFFVFFTLFIVFSLYFLICFWKGKSKIAPILGSLFYLILALPLAGPALSDLGRDFPFKLTFALICAAIAAIACFRRISSIEGRRKGFSWPSSLLHAGFLILGLGLIGVNAIENLASERPILKISLTGALACRHMEWKNPQGPFQQTDVQCHEVVLKTIDGEELGRYLLPGDLVAIRAKTFRFHPFLNALGISTKFRFDLVYSGYRKAEDYRLLPVESHPFSQPASLLNSLLFKYWESFFCKQADALWIRSATCESNYFPMEDEQGNPVTGEFLLTISSFGLSSI